MPVSFGHLVHTWNQFFFASTSALPLAQFRIAFGCVLLYEAFFISRNLDAYLGPTGLIRHSSFVRQSSGKALSVFLYVPGEINAVRVVFAVHVVAVSCMTIGFLTPVSTAVAFVTIRSIVNRNPMIANGGDNVAKIMCFLLIFTGSGHALSLDQLLGFHGTDARTLQGPWALRLMQIQVSLIYIWTAYWKLAGRTWRNGTALYYAVANHAYRRWPVPGFLLRTPWLQMLTWTGFAFEWLIGPALWISPLRPYAAVCAIAFHVFLEYMLNLHLFGWYMIACLLLFITL